MDNHQIAKHNMCETMAVFFTKRSSDYSSYAAYVTAVGKFRHDLGTWDGLIPLEAADNTGTFTSKGSAKHAMADYWAQIANSVRSYALGLAVVDETLAADMNLSASMIFHLKDVDAKGKCMHISQTANGILSSLTGHITQQNLNDGDALTAALGGWLGKS